VDGLCGAMRGGAVAGGLLRGHPPDGATCSRRAGLQQCYRNVQCELPLCSVSVLM
jgi:hypothetical protein